MVPGFPYETPELGLKGVISRASLNGSIELMWRVPASQEARDWAWQLLSTSSVAWEGTWRLRASQVWAVALFAIFRPNWFNGGWRKKIGRPVTIP